MVPIKSHRENGHLQPQQISRCEIRWPLLVQGEPLRRVTHAVVGHACEAQSWHLEWLEVQIEGREPSTVRFYCCSWLSLSRGPGRLQACLSSTADPMVECAALVRTGDCRSAGTSAGDASPPPRSFPLRRFQSAIIGTVRSDWGDHYTHT